MQGSVGCRDAPAITGHDRVHPIIVNVAVEDFAPRSGKREADSIVIPGIFGEGCDDNYVLARTLEPPVEGSDAVLIVNVKRMDVLPTQGGIVPPQADQVLCEAQVVYHRRIASGIEARPPNQIRRGRVATPLLVLKKLLPHEELRNSRGGQQEAGREARTAARIPGTVVGAVGKSRNAQVRTHLHDVVILDARNCLPAMGKSLRIKIARDRIEIDGGALAIGRSRDGTADRAAQAVVLDDVESRAAIVRRRYDRSSRFRIVSDLSRPELRVLQEPRLHVAKRAGEIRAEAPARITIHRNQVADLVVAESVDVEFVDI